MVALLISVTSLTLLLSTYPYKRPEDNVLAAGCQLTLIFSFIGASLIRLHEVFSIYLDVGTVSAVMYFSSTTVIATPLGWPASEPASAEQRLTSPFFYELFTYGLRRPSAHSRCSRFAPLLLK